MTNTKIKKNEEVFFIASQYKKEPIKVDYYTKSQGAAVPKDRVIKKETELGVRFFVGA
ncbi:MAG: hypothetical protein AAB929_05995 [Patescibacteria group bacterium]